MTNNKPNYEKIGLYLAIMVGFLTMIFYVADMKERIRALEVKVEHLESKMHYTVKDLATIFKYDPQTIRRLIREKRIHAFRLGKGKNSHYRIMQEEVGRLRQIGFEEQSKFSL